MTRFTIPPEYWERLVAEWEGARKRFDEDGTQPVDALLQRAAHLASEEPGFAQVLEQAARWIRVLSTWMRRMTAAG